MIYEGTFITDPFNESLEKLQFDDERCLKYFEGHINGNGILYNKGIKIFNGTFINGKKEGKGIYYFENGKIQFEGNHKNDEKNGYGLFYNENGTLIFNGTFVNGIKEGKGTMEKYIFKDYTKIITWMDMVFYMMKMEH